VFSYHQVKEHPKRLLAMTGLSHAAFHQLLPHFQYAWDQYVQQYYVDRDNRQRQYGAGRSASTLVHIEDKLLFILYEQLQRNLSRKSVVPRVRIYVASECL
jgi:hypothetical protein